VGPCQNELKLCGIKWGVGYDKLSRGCVALVGQS